MSFITITSAQISGSLFPAATSDRTLNVAKGVQAPVIMTGYVGAGEVKAEDGSYKPTAYGRISLEAAKAGEGEKTRLVLSAGGLRGVLFKAEGKSYDYSGRFEAGDGNEFPIFGRKVEGKSGAFIAISSMERQPMEKAESAPAPVSNDTEFDNSIPF